LTCLSLGRKLLRAVIGHSISQCSRNIEDLGGGGMGVVYTGEDTRLHRLRSMAFLFDAVSRDPQALSHDQRVLRGSAVGKTSLRP
jgi:hypothetical protein